MLCPIPRCYLLRRGQAPPKTPKDRPRLDASTPLVKFSRKHSTKGVHRETFTAIFQLTSVSVNDLRKRALESETMLLGYYY